MADTDKKDSSILSKRIELLLAIMNGAESNASIANDKNTKVKKSESLNDSISSDESNSDSEETEFSSNSDINRNSQDSITWSDISVKNAAKHVSFFPQSNTQSNPYFKDKMHRVIPLKIDKKITKLNSLFASK